MRILAKKSLGQNFLMHRQTAERIVEAASLPPDAIVLEIGPGTGMLTAALLEKTGRVLAVEADESLIPALEERFRPEIDAGRLTLIPADIRTFDTSILPAPYHVVANIPYYITGELLRTFLSADHKPASLTFLVQKEVALRIARSQKESLLSLAVKAYGTPRYVFTVPRGAFRPAPSVDSAVLHISAISSANFSSPRSEKLFFDLLHTGFAHKRKRLAKNLEVVAPKNRVSQAFEELALGEGARAENVSLPQWLLLAEKLAS